MSDYERIGVAIRYLTENARSQPSIDDVAAHIGLSPSHFQRLFARWAGVTPKRFLQILTVDRAKQLLSESRAVLDVSHEVGLSGGSRLYDHFVQLEAVTPGEFKSRGSGLVIDHAVHETPFGDAFIAMTHRGICALAFPDEDPAEPLDRLARDWTGAELRESPERTASTIETIFSRPFPDKPLSLHVSGTNFQTAVWRALIDIPCGSVGTYSDIAQAIGNPKSTRAVGSAVGANPIAFIIPCHRVIRQDGGIGGYHWGETRKHAIHAWESAAV